MPLAKKKTLPNSIEEDTALFGSNSILDSLDLINLVVAVEARVQKETGHVISLADDKALSQEASPFETIRSLKNYTLMLIK